MRKEHETPSGRRAPRAVFAATAALLLLAAAPVRTTAQSTEVIDGSNGVAIGVYAELDERDLFQVGAYTAFSIAGIMDIGGFFAREAETVAGREGTNTSLGLVYNLMPLKQQPGIPLSMQLRLAYGLTLVDRDLVVAELQQRFENGAPFNIDRVDSTRTSYTFGAGVLRDFRQGELVSLRLGADVAYRVTRSTYSAVLTELDGDDDDDDGTEQTVGFRETRLYFGPSAGVTLRLPEGPVVTFLSRFWFNEDRDLVFRPELSAILFQYQ